jgi:hypothetical protein
MGSQLLSVHKVPVAVPAVAGTVLLSVGDATAGLGHLSELPEESLTSRATSRLEQQLDKRLNLD